MDQRLAWAVVLLVVFILAFVLFSGLIYSYG